MELGHPILSLFGHSADSTFPLILAIGREPNGPYPVTNHVGSYDFRDAPTCGFWNTAYGIAARLLGTNTSALKQRAVQENGSPFVFADALPHGIPTRVKAKHTQRAALPATDVLRHVDNLFSHEPVIERVRLVIVSGLRARVFATALQAIERNCEARGLPLAQTAFFFGPNLRMIMDQLSEEQKQLICSVFA